MSPIRVRQRQRAGRHWRRGSVPVPRAAATDTVAVEVILDLEELLGIPLAAGTDEDILLVVVGAAGSDLLADGALLGRFGHVEIIAPSVARAAWAPGTPSDIWRAERPDIRQESARPEQALSGRLE